MCLFISACFTDPETKQNAELFCEQNNQVQIKIPVGNWISKDKLVYLSQVHDDAKNMDLFVTEVIDLPTFDWLFNDPQDRQKVNNDYYLKDDIIIYYFKDKNHVYIASPEVPVLVLVGDATDYKVLGGAYLRVDKDIYYRGKKIEGADSKTFKTMNVVRKSEWLATLGLDQHYIYTGTEPVTNYADFEYMFNNIYISGGVDSLRRQYFPL